MESISNRRDGAPVPPQGYEPVETPASGAALPTPADATPAGACGVEPQPGDLPPVPVAAASQPAASVQPDAACPAVPSHPAESERAGESLPIPADGFPAMPPVANGDPYGVLFADPASSVPVRPWIHFAKWLAAVAGAFVASVAIQLVFGMLGGIVAGLFMAGPDAAELSEDAMLLVMVAVQLIEIAIIVPWWQHVREGGFGARRVLPGAETSATVAGTLLALAAMALSIQYLLDFFFGLVEMLSPDALAEYNELMEESGIGIFSVLSVISTAVLAPVGEEILCRGIMFEYALRAVSPAWTGGSRASGASVSIRGFWVANFIQALAFGVLHLNLIQGAYAFALGMLLGWVYWRTGKLRYSIALHLIFNSLSYAVEPLAELLWFMPAFLFYALMVALFVWGLGRFRALWSRPDSLSAQAEHPLP